jgi:hypothetical protein
MSFWFEWFKVNEVVTWCRMTARGCWGLLGKGKFSMGKIDGPDQRG